MWSADKQLHHHLRLFDFPPQPDPLDQSLPFNETPRWCVSPLILEKILWDPMDCIPPGSSVHGILQARVLEWVAIPFSRGNFSTQGSNLGLLHCGQIFQFESLGKPIYSKGVCLFFFFLTFICLFGCAGSSLQHAGSNSCSTACEILVPGPGIKPMSPAQQAGFLTAGLPGKSLKGDLYQAQLISRCHLVSSLISQPPES